MVINGTIYAAISKPEMLEIKQFCFNPFQENTYLLSDTSKETLIIDPGCISDSEFNELYDEITESGLKPVAIINTHCHVDHVLGNKRIKEFYKIPLFIHEMDQFILKSVKTYAPTYGINNFEETEADGFVNEGANYTFGDTELQILHVPGHSPGHIALYHPESAICIAGDVLFNGSIGRADLPGGDFDTLIHSIRTKLFTLPDVVKVYPGHGPYTTIGHEKLTNPFCGINA